MDYSISSSIVGLKERTANVMLAMKPTAEHLLAEFTSFKSVSMPVRERINILSQGFNSQANVIYDFKNHQSSEYVTDYQRRQAGCINQPWIHLLNDKLAFYHLLSEFPDHRPSLYGVLNEGVLHRVDKAGVTTDPFHWLRRRLTSDDRIVLKPVAGTAGIGVTVLSYKDDVFLSNDTAISEEELRKEVETATETLVCGHVNQADYSDDLYPLSANSIRILTMYDETRNEAFIATAVQRIGTDESAPVDNWSSGGLSAGITRESGDLTAAVQSPDGNNLIWHNYHPDSGAQIAGTTIPRWEKVCETVVDIAETVSYLPYIGWDIIITDDDFVILEANARTDVDLLQVHGPLLANQRVRDFYEYHGII